MKLKGLKKGKKSGLSNSGVIQKVVPQEGGRNSLGGVLSTILPN